MLFIKGYKYIVYLLIIGKRGVKVSVVKRNKRCNCKSVKWYYKTNDDDNPKSNEYPQSNHYSTTNPKPTAGYPNAPRMQSAQGFCSPSNYCYTWFQSPATPA